MLILKLSKSGMPITGLIISSILTSLILIVYENKNIIEQFTMIGNLTILSTLIPYGITTIANLILINKKNKKIISIDSLLSIIALFYIAWAISECIKNVFNIWIIITMLSTLIYLIKK